MSIVSLSRLSSGVIYKPFSRNTGFICGEDLSSIFRTAPPLDYSITPQTERALAPRFDQASIELAVSNIFFAPISF